MLYLPARGTLRCCARGAFSRRFIFPVIGSALLLFLSFPGVLAAEAPGDDLFPIGVWSQPHIYFDKWQARGINTLMRYENYGGAAGHDIDSWVREANKRGLYQIRQARPDAAKDKNESLLLAWMHE